MDQEKLLDLIARSKAGDSSAQEQLVMAVQNKVYYHCKKFLKNEEDAQDATQDVLITMLTSLEKLREPAAFWGWVNSITTNRCKNLLTRGPKEWQIPEDEEGNSMLDSIETLDDQAIPDQALDNEETRRLVMEIIDGLPAEQRMTVVFFYYDEMSVKDIAGMMEVSEGTVKSRLNYARKAIKLQVEKLEKKGTKLYSISILPFLAYFLRMGAETQTLSPAAAAAVTQGTMATAGTAAAAGATTAGATAAGAATATGTTAAGTTTAAGAAVGAKVAGAISVKVIAGVLAGVLAAGGVGAAAYLSSRPDPEPVVTPAAVVTPEPTPEPTPEDTPEPAQGAVLDFDFSPYVGTYTADPGMEASYRCEALDVTLNSDGSLSGGGATYAWSSGGISGTPTGTAPIELRTGSEGHGGPGSYTLVLRQAQVTVEDHTGTVEEYYILYPQGVADTRGGDTETVRIHYVDATGGVWDMFYSAKPSSEPVSESDFVIRDGVLIEYLGSGGDVTVPSGVTAIRNNVFMSCTSLTGITIPESVTTIGHSIFVNCTSLTRVTISEGMTTIGDRAFSGCELLTDITIPKSVTAIGEGAFIRCASLTDVTIPEGVTSIGEHSFYKCSSLTNITIPNSVTTIGEAAFAGCESLTGITIPEGVTAIDEFTFNKCTSLTGITIPKGVTTIGADAFFACTSLTRVAIPEGVTSIGHAAFLNCMLTDVYFAGTEGQWDSIAKDGCGIPDSATIHYNSAMPD